MIGALADDSAAVRLSALNALGELHARDAVPAVSKLLEDRNENVRAQAASVLSKLKELEKD